MQYLLLIYANEAETAALDEATMKGLMGEFKDFTESLAQSGKYQTSARLRPVGTATTVRVRNGRTVCTDGPFAETREQLGGFYLIGAKDLDDALAIAARVPAARYGSIEVRPIWPVP
jgi:hypothetical protein